jgi:hypothetical protein
MLSDGDHGRRGDSKEETSGVVELGTGDKLLDFGGIEVVLLLVLVGSGLCMEGGDVWGGRREE